MKLFKALTITVVFTLVFALTASANVTDNLIMYYSFDGENPGADALEGNSLTIPAEQVVDGIIGKGVSIVGAEQVIQNCGMDAYGPFFDSNCMTVAAWIKCYDPEGTATLTLFGWGSGGTYDFTRTFISADNNFGVYWQRPDGHYYANCNVNVNIRDGNWHHVAYTYSLDSGELLFYVDGVEYANEENAGLDGFLGEPLNGWFTLGGMNGREDPFNGCYDDIRFYDRVLSDKDIAELYAMGSKTPETEAPETEAPVTEAPVTDAPVTDPETTPDTEPEDSPNTSDAALRVAIAVGAGAATLTGSLKNSGFIVKTINSVINGFIGAIAKLFNFIR